MKLNLGGDVYEADVELVIPGWGERDEPYFLVKVENVNVQFDIYGEPVQKDELQTRSFRETGPTLEAALMRLIRTIEGAM